MAEQTPQAHDAAIALLRIIVDEIKAAAHDPAIVHVVAEKLKNGIDALEKALAKPEGEKKA